MTKDKNYEVPIVTTEQVKQQMVYVIVTMENGKPVIKVEDRVVEPNNLESELRNYVRATKKTQMLLQIEDEVPHSVMVTVQDAAKGAGMEKVSLVVPDKADR